MITVTDLALAKIKEIAESEGIEKLTVRVGVKGGGCAGFTTDMVFDENISDTDQIFEYDGVKIVIDMISIGYLEGTEIDYIEGLVQSGFKFNNPQAEHTCGCGKSWG